MGSAGVSEAALEEAMRDHWARLVAQLVRRFRRVDLAEDCLAEAFAAAAKHWPREGVPRNPAGWLHTAAQRRALDALRTEEVARRKQPLMVIEADRQGEVEPATPVVDGGPSDDRLRLLLLTCHPALGPEIQAALALRLVLGVPTADIAALFLVPTATMAARITRGKRKIAESGLPFALPASGELGGRADAVVRTAYLAFTAGYAPGTGPDLLRADQASEAIRLTRLLDELLPGRPATQAALALMILQHARRDARVRDGELVLLSDQDRGRWHHVEIEAGLAVLTRLPPSTGYAEELRLQALIAGLHSSAPTPETTDWPTICGAYEELERITGSPVVRLNRAVAVAEVDGPEAGLALLDGLGDRLPRSHRLPAVRAELLRRTGDRDGARLAYDQALAAGANDVERRHLVRRRSSL